MYWGAKNSSRYKNWLLKKCKTACEEKARGSVRTSRVYVCRSLRTGVTRNLPPLHSQQHEAYNIIEIFEQKDDFWLRRIAQVFDFENFEKMQAVPARYCS